MSYPCPTCNSPASPQTGCPGCGRGPDADAAEMVRLDAEIADLNAKLAYARQAVRDIPPQIDEAWVQRNAAATRVRAARTPPTAPDPVPASPQPPASVPAFRPSAAPASALRLLPPPDRVRGAEASTKLVQNLLFLLGGLLLAVAAIVFTAVAWAQFGVGGRAALLAFFTGAALAVPPVALRRKLSATAETFAAVGLLLVLLDGYAAWYVNLFGLADASPWGYAGAVCAVTAAVAAGYEHVTGLTGPRFAALVIAQPVVPLLVVLAHPGAPGWALAFSVVGALDVAVLALRRLRFQVGGVGIAAYLGGAASVLIAGCCALFGLAGAESALSAAGSGGALLAPVLVVLVAVVLARNAIAQAVAGGLVVVALDVAGIGLALRLGSGSRLLRVAIVTSVVVAMAVAARRLLPPVVARGPRVGAFAVITMPALAAVALVADAAVFTLDAAGPMLSAGWGASIPYAGWALIVSILLLTAALTLVAPAAWRGEVVLGAAVLTALALPAGLHLRWWSAPIFDLVVVAGALALAIRYVAPAGWPPLMRSIAAGVPAAPATDHAATTKTVPLGGPAFSFRARILVVVLLGLHAVTAGFGRAGVAAGVLGVVALLGFATAVLTHAGPRRRDLGGAGLLTGLLAVPVMGWTTTSALSTAAVVQSRIVLAAVALMVVGRWVIARGAPGYRPFALAAVLLVVVSAPAWAVASGDSPAVYAAVALLLLALTVPGASIDRAEAGSAGVAAVGAELGWTAVAAVPVGLALVVATGRSLFRVFFEPYHWLGLIWAGRPVGLPHVPAVDAVALGLAGIAAALVGYLLPGCSRAVRRRVAGWTAVPVLAVALPVGLAAARAPWPVVPGVELVLGVAGLVVAALRRAPISIPLAGALLAGAGLAGALPTHGATLAALGAVLIAAAVAGSSGRTEPIRVTGWILAVATAFGLAGTAGDALELKLRIVAFLVLGMAAVAFASSWLLATYWPAAPARGGNRVGEGRAIEAAAHAGAVLALLLTVGSIRHTAAVCVLWGVALGIRALGVRALGAPSASTAAAESSGGPAVPERHVAEPGGRGAIAAVRHAYIVAAAVAEFAGWCLLMAAANMSTVEVFTVPAAAVALLAGLLARRRRPSLSSWTAYGPALAAALLPSLAAIAGAGEQHPRRLLLGLAALVIVVAGANARLKAPVVLGGGALSLVALHELAQVWDLVPRWIPLAAGGLLLVLLAMTLERRRRDLARFRAALTRMS